MKFWYIDVNRSTNFNLPDFFNFVDKFALIHNQDDVLFRLSFGYFKEVAGKASKCILVTMDDFRGESDLLHFGFTEVDDNSPIILLAKYNFVNLFLKNGTVEYNFFNKLITPENSEDYRMYESLLFCVENNCPTNIRLIDLALVEHRFLNKHGVTVFTGVQSIWYDTIFDNYASNSYIINKTISDMWESNILDSIRLNSIEDIKI